ncbi:MAG: HD domain-containing protein [Clostridia bacterium]|nr:HD domain-containing protein [Clostridia bacterium]
MLFKKKKTEEKVEEQQNKIPEDVMNPEVDSTAEKFSGRMGSIFGNMYRMILSVNLNANACQIESGDRNLCGDVLPARMYYSAFVDYLAKHMHPDDQESFAKDFAPQALADALTAANGGYSKVYMLAITPKKDKKAEIVSNNGEASNNDEDGSAFLASLEELEEELDARYYEFRADVIPDKNPVKTKCIIYIKEVAEKPVDFHFTSSKKNLPAELTEIDWAKIRMERFFEGDGAIFFEYNVAEDLMYINDAELTNVNTIKNYLRAIDVRSDWSIFHSDVKRVKKAIEDAINNVSSTIDIRYRANGLKTAPFRYFRFHVAAADDAVPSKWVVGVLNDVDEEVKAAKSAKDIADHVDSLMDSLFTDMFEIDLEKDTLVKIVRTENGFEKSEFEDSLSQTLAKYIANGVIAPESASLYEKWLKKGHLERATLVGKYEFESKLKLPGHTEYGWYSETITKLEGTRRYLRLRRDISDIAEMRQKQSEMAELSRYSAYNEKMLDTMASLVEFRNVETGPHISHVRQLTKILLTDLANRSPLYNITPKQIEIYTEAATMHDIGKIVVPDVILNKPGKLSADEYAVIKSHTIAGAKIVDKLVLPGKEELMACCRDVALHHHERFDGSGYPDGLVGDANSIGVQAVGLADVYDAMISVRCYKEGMDSSDAVQSILSGECGSFNPKLLESFKYCQDKMFELYENLSE